MKLSFLGPKLSCENLVDRVARECFGHPPRDLHHASLAAVDAKDCKREVQWFLDRPDLVVLIGRKNGGGTPTATQLIGTVAPAIFQRALLSAASWLCVLEIRAPH
jgi:hypothetical protein